MNVTKNQLDECNAVLTINVKKEDIAENVSNKLKEYRKNANVPGFRKGNVPMGMIKKMYQSSIIAEELNQIVSKGLYEFISEEKLKVLGEPLPNENQDKIDFNNADEFNFLFDIATSPEFDINLTKREKITEYIVKADEKTKKDYIENFQNRFGKLVDVEESTEKTIVEGAIMQINENGEDKEGGIVNEETKIDVGIIKDNDIKSKFVGLKSGDSVDFNIVKAFDGNETEISSLLNVKKEDIQTLEPNFRFKVNAVKLYEKAEVDEELYKKAFPKDEIKTKEEFEEKISKLIEESFAEHTKYIAIFDIREKLVSKFDKELPEEFLKRWLKATNKEITDEQIEQEFDKFLENLKWSLVKQKLAADNEIKVSEEDIMQKAREITLAQLRQYGLAEMAEKDLDTFAQRTLEKEEDKNRIAEQAMEDKVVEFAKEQIKIEDKEVSVDELNEISKKKFQQ